MSKVSKRREPTIFIYFIYLISTQLFTYTGYSKLHLGWFFVICCGSLYFILLYNAIYIKRKCERTNFSSYHFVSLFVILPLFTTVSCYIAHGQSIPLSIWVMWYHFTVSIYFYFVYIGFSKKQILDFLTILMLVKLGLTVIEQFTYPYVPFTARLVDGFTSEGKFQEVEVRSGIYRYTIADAYYLYLIIGFYSFTQLIKAKDIKNCFLFIASCVGIYMDQSRQIMVSFMLSLFIISFLQSGTAKLKYLLLFGILIISLYGFYDFLFGELTEQTGNQMSDGYIRFVAYSYYYTNMGGMLTTLFGNGFGGFSFSAWGKEIAYQEVTLGLNRADIGVVGALHLLGVVFVVVFFSYYILVLLRYWKYIDGYIKMMFISILINIPMLFPLYNLPLGGIDFFMGCLFYLTDKSIRDNKKKKEIMIAFKLIAKSKGNDRFL